MDLASWVKTGKLHFHCERPTNRGLEDHLAMMQRMIQELEPTLVVIDPVSSLARGATAFDVSAMLMRQVYYLKSAGITAIMTLLTDEGELAESVVNISSLVDTAVELVILSAVGERNRGLFVVKSRGTAHSNQIREFVLSDTGVDVVPVVIGPTGLLTGSARIAAESVERATAEGLSLESSDLTRALEHRRETVEAHVATLMADLEAEERLTQQLIEASEQRQKAEQMDRLAQGKRRSATNPEVEQ
jgi:circadian clock protein KaiC